MLFIFLQCTYGAQMTSALCLHRGSPAHSHFDVGVRESVDVHGRQVSAAPHADTEGAAEPPFASVSGGQELQREQQAASLLQAVQLLLLPLQTAPVKPVHLNQSQLKRAQTNWEHWDISCWAALKLQD